MNAVDVSLMERAGIDVRVGELVMLTVRGGDRSQVWSKVTEGYPMDTTDTEQITFKALQAALDRCMKAHPPIGEERRMHPDANRMADLFAPMVLERAEAVPRSSVKASILEAFDRWQPNAAPA